MNEFSMVVFIVVAVMAASAFKHWAKLQAEKQRARQGSADDELKAKVGALEERVKVLERIATDKSHRLKEEIDAL